MNPFCEGKRLCVFAAANTAKGFCSRFGEVFSPDVWERVYIIKGGPGTGKSSFLRAVGEAAEARGEEVRYYLCSSDPSSLDGVTLPGRGIALFDGTAPHTAEPVYPGAVEEIVNMGMFFDTKVLTKALPRIREYQERYGAEQRLAARYLRAAGELREAGNALCRGAVLGEKLGRAAKRLLSQIPAEKAPAEKTRFLTAAGKQGLVHLDTMERLCENRIYVSDRRGCAGLVLDGILDYARQKGLSLVRFPDFLLPEETEGLYFPAGGLYIGTDRYGVPAGAECVNADRFLDTGALAECRTRHRFSRQCTASLLEGAYDALRSAGAVHDALEALYISAMDFKAKETYTSRFVKSVFSCKK